MMRNYWTHTGRIKKSCLHPDWVKTSCSQELLWVYCQM